MNSGPLGQFETLVNHALFGACLVDQLSQEEGKWFRGLDLMELYLWCLDQRMMGNLNYTRWINKIGVIFKNEGHRFPIEIINLFFEARSDGWQMTACLGDET